MCEWLATGDWCDVQLFCGGHSFNAHRAVLASASSFLRRILISGPVEETTIIFLPDFDLEAFSSVLYYIYNGEVAIQKHKLQNFIDTVKALEIFVDLQSLQKSNPLEKELYSNIFLLENTYNNKKSHVFSLNSGSNSDQQYINIKKGENNHDSHSEYSPNESEFRDNQALFKNWPDLRPSIQNLPTFYFDRQKNFFPRDLCLETHPQSGNANGLVASVLAIPNEPYRAPASVVLTNANGKHPRANDILSDITRKTTDHAFHFGYRDHVYTENNNFPKESTSKLIPDLNFSTNKDSTCSIISEEEVKDNWTNLSSFPASSSSLLQNMGDQLLPDTLSSSHEFADSLHSTSTMTSQKPELEYINALQPVDENKYLQTNNHFAKTSASIYNQVLENPWCSRLTFNYRPTTKKNPCFIIDDKEVNVDLINDNNNNIQPTESTSVELSDKVLSTCQDFKCAICCQIFPDSRTLAEHARQHSTPGRYTCGECGKTFSQLRNFKYHMSVHRGTREFAATCTVCGKYFNDRGYLSSHMKIHRNRKEYKCSMCPKSFNQRVAYNMHVRIHTGVKPHVCDQCGKAFSRKMLLKQHQRTHSGERPYVCPHCDKRFADRSNMTLHLRLHTGVKPFSCSMCPKSFTKKHHLKSHLNFHTGAKPYSCPLCKLSFTQSSNMRTHYKKCSTPTVVDTT